MKTPSLFAFGFILISSIYSSQRTKIKRHQNEITGKLINPISSTSNCGYIAYATVLEFEIIDANTKNNADKIVPIIVPCPEFYGENFFKQDSIYSLKIADKKQTDFGWTIPNPNIIKKYNLEKNLWLIKATKKKKLK